MMTVRCPDNNCTSRHILNGHGGRVKFATGSIARRISGVRSSTGSWKHYWEHYRTRHTEQGPRASGFGCTNPTMNLFFSVSFLPCVSLFSSLPHLLTAFACGPVCPDSLFFLSPFHSHAVATVCSPDTPPGPSVTTYVSFRDDLTVHVENRVPLAIAIFTRYNTVPDKVLAPTTKVSWLKKRIWDNIYMTYMRLANFIIVGTKVQMINGGEAWAAWEYWSFSCKIHYLEKKDLEKKERYWL